MSPRPRHDLAAGGSGPSRLARSGGFRSLLLASTTLALLLACDSGTSPVAPDDKKDIIFTISAHPDRMPPDGTSEIRVVATHKSGVPAREGTEIRFTTTIGTIDPVVPTDRDGVAVATLRGDGRKENAKVSATSGSRGIASDDKIEVTVTIDDPADNLVAGFSTDPSPPTSLTIKFKASTAGDPTSWEWDFGDGGTSREPNPLHIFAKADFYQIELRVANGSVSDTTSKLLRIGAEAKFTPTPSGLEVTFRDGSTGDPFGWEWSFGDGASSKVQNPTHTYAAAGEYTVRLGIRTRDAGNDETSQAVRVEAAQITKPEADFSTDDSGLTVIFSDTSKNEPTSWDWDFGDGRGSREENPVHTYKQAGTYLVTLTVSNSAGSDSISRFVTVS